MTQFDVQHVVRDRIETFGFGHDLSLARIMTRLLVENFLINTGKQPDRPSRVLV